MKYIEVVAEEKDTGTVARIADNAGALDFRLGPLEGDGKRRFRFFVRDDTLQVVLDTYQELLGQQPTARVAVLGVDTYLPAPGEEERKKEDAAIEARESLYQEVEKNARLDPRFALLTALSTLVAAIGLVKGNVAVVIGSMVIAPLLGPNLALSLGTALGDVPLMRKAAASLLAGVGLSVVISAGLGLLLPGPLRSPELLALAQTGLDSVALALASGAAAALSITTGLSGVLVGVMVAVALLPPAAACGLFLGHGATGPALEASILLAVNIVCVNLSSKLVFLARGVRPRTWLEKEKARRATVIYVVVWILTLAALVGIIVLRHPLQLWL